MTTEDVKISTSDGWKEIDIGTTYVLITQVRHNDIQVRVGNGSTSIGVDIPIGVNTFKSPEKIYVKKVEATGYKSSLSALVTIIKD